MEPLSNSFKIMYLPLCTLLSGTLKLNWIGGSKDMPQPVSNYDRGVELHLSQCRETREGVVHEN